MTQIALKLPDELVGALDALVARGRFPSRSAAVRRGIEVVVAEQQRELLDTAYVEGYRNFPETEEELREAERLAVQSIADEPWIKWW